MKFEKLNDTKIKISVSMYDMEQNNVSIQNLFSNSEPSQKLLQNMLKMAESKIGFEVNDSQILIEATLASDEECIFIITKLQESFSNTPQNNNFIFKFDNFDNFINLCTFLNNFSDLNLKDFSQNFSLIWYNSTYYLYDSNVENFSVLLDYMKNVFAEFGTNVSDSPSINGILNEYGKIIFEKNAIIKCIYSFIK